MQSITPQKLILFILITYGMVSAQDVRIQSSVSKNRVGLNEQFEFKVEVSGQSTNLPSPTMPALDDFNVLSGPNTSQSIQLINGRMSSSKSFSYYLQPKQVGSFKIGPAQIEVDGKGYQSNEITVEVIKGQAAPAPSGPQPQPSTDAALLGEDLYLKAIVNKRTVYQNEPVIVTYKLYFKGNVRRTYPGKQPAYPGFWTEKFDLPAQPPVETEIVNGVSYNTAVLDRVALFPTRSGDLEVDPMTIMVDVLVRRQRSSRSLFDDFFDDPFGRTVRQTLSTDAVKIKVLPLPVSDKPAVFNGAVGNYTLDFRIDKRDVPVNEAISAKIEISGEGNIKLLDLPELQLPSDMEVYEPKESTNISRSDSRITGSKSVEYVIVPRFEGQYKMKPVYFAFFDPRNKVYKTLQTEPVTLNITAGSGFSTKSAGSSITSRQEVSLLGEDIRFIKDQTSFQQIGSFIYMKWWYWSAYLVPVLGMVLAWLYRTQTDKLRNDQNLARRRRAGKIASKHLEQARKSMGENDGKDFYRYISQALQGFVSDRLNLQMTDFTSESVEQNLSRVGVKAEEISEYQACLSESDFRQFSATSSSYEEMRSFYDRSKKILTLLERYI